MRESNEIEGKQAGQESPLESVEPFSLVESLRKRKEPQRVWPRVARSYLTARRIPRVMVHAIDPATKPILAGLAELSMLAGLLVEDLFKSAEKWIPCHNLPPII